MLKPQYYFESMINMEEKQQQEDCNCNPQHDKVEANSITTSSKQSSKENNKEQLESTTYHQHQHQHQHTCADTEEQMMKLIVRSPYWGRILKGKTCGGTRNVYTSYNMNNNSKNKAPRVITSQAILYNTDGFWGCCPHHGKRVLEMQECHFSDSAEGFSWDLYLVGTWISPSHSVHDFFFLPQNQTLVDINRNVLLNGWSYVGTCRAEGIRSGLDVMLRNLLQENEATYGHRYHHVHIDLMMDQVFDRETPRSRKANNEKTRTDRNVSSNSRRYHPQQESSVTTEGTASTEQESPPSTIDKAGGSNVKNSCAHKSAEAPPIPRVISNDSSMISDSAVPHSVANAAIAYRDTNISWTGEADYWNALSHSLPPHHTPSYSIGGSAGSFVNGNDYYGMYWHPGKATSIPYGGGLQQQHHHQQHHQQHPYWHHMSTSPYAGVPHPHHHSPDMHQHYMMISEPRVDPHLQPFYPHHHHHHHHAPPDISADAGAFTSSYPYVMGNNTMKNMTSKILPSSATCITMSDSSLTSCTVEGPDMAGETSSPPSLLNTCTVDGPDMAGEELPVMPTPSELLATVTEA